MGKINITVRRDNIVEFSTGNMDGPGGLMSFRLDEHGVMHVDVYRTEGSAVVIHGTNDDLHPTTIRPSS